LEVAVYQHLLAVLPSIKPSPRSYDHQKACGNFNPLRYFILSKTTIFDDPGTLPLTPSYLLNSLLCLIVDSDSVVVLLTISRLMLSSL